MLTGFMALLVVFLTFFLWSSTFTIGISTLECSPPVFLTAIRMLLGGGLILGFLGLFRRKEMKIKKHQWFPLFLLAVTAVYLSNVMEFWGLQFLTSAKACFIYSLSPFMSAVFSYFQFKEKMTWKKVAGLLVGFVGFIPYMLTQSPEHVEAGSALFSWPELSLVGATATSVYGWVLLRKLTKNEGMSPLMANGMSMVIGGALALGHSYFTDNWDPTPVTEYSGFFKGVGLLILVSNLVCYNLYGWLLKRFSATFLSFAGMMTPLFAAFFGWAVLGETVTWPFFASMGVVSLGLWLVYSEELRLGYITKKRAKRQQIDGECCRKSLKYSDKWSIVKS